MRVWLVTIGEPLHTDPGPPRLLRGGILARRLAEAGHDVCWWTSSFDHTRKCQRSGPQDQVVSPGLRLRLMRARGYQRNISLGRLLDHRRLASTFAAEARTVPPPDLIVASYPPVELALQAVQYGREHGIPVIVDVRDLWPDIVLDHAPRPLRPLARALLSGMFAESAKGMRGATAIVGITDPFVRWGLARAGRAPSPWDRDFPLAYPQASHDRESTAQAQHWWATTHNVTPGPSARITFLGSMGQAVDLQAVIAAARQLRDRPVQFVLGGAGEGLAEVVAAARDLPNVVVPGWLDGPRINALLAMSWAGIAPYRPRWDFLMSYPNKVIEYLSAGLPVLSGIQGLVGDLVEQERCGVVYRTGTPGAELSDVVARLEQTPGLPAEMGSNARRVFLERFSEDAVYGQMVRYLEEVARVMPPTAGARSQR